jgi:NADH-quinone oxidoreductase subunit N
MRYPDDFLPGAAIAYPLLALVLGASLIVLIDLLNKKKNIESLITTIAICSCLVGWLGGLSAWFLKDFAFSRLAIADPFTFVFFSIILMGTALSILLNSDSLEYQGVRARSDVTVLILLSACGGLVMVSTSHFIVMFLGFEILSLGVYILSGTARHEKASSEAAFKYFVLGAFSAAFMLYGMSLVFGVTGTMEMTKIAEILNPQTARDPIMLIGVGLIIFGFVFKIGLAPFHFWAPDVYQGAPTSITTFMAVVVKAAAVGGLMRIVALAFPDLQGIWVGVLSVIAGLSMTVGNLVALRQRSIKRMLAYSSVAHAGYLTLGLLVGTSGGWAATIFYVFVYALMTVASFGVVLAASAGTQKQYLNDSIESLRGLGWRSPFLGLVMTIAILSLAGFPPFAGFFGKLYLFKAAVTGGFVGLVILAAINSLISLYYYLSIIVVLYFPKYQAHGEHHEHKEVIDAPPAVRPAAQIAMGIATVLLVVTGIYSGRLIEISAVAADRGLTSGSKPVYFEQLGGEGRRVSSTGAVGVSQIEAVESNDGPV